MRSASYRFDIANAPKIATIARDHCPKRPWPSLLTSSQPESAEPHPYLWMFPKATLICPAIWGHPLVRIAPLHLDDGLLHQIRRRILRIRASNVDFLNAIATRRSLLGLIQSEQNPTMRRSRTWRFGARRCQRLSINTLCLVRTDSAIAHTAGPNDTQDHGDDMDKEENQITHIRF
jgi:hypothetical protein